MRVTRQRGRGQNFRGGGASCWRAWYVLAVMSGGLLVYRHAAGDAEVAWWLMLLPVGVPVLAAAVLGLIGLWLEATAGLVRWAFREGGER